MALLSWSNQYAIGDDVIDTEHEELFRLINDFHNRWMEAHDRQHIARVFNQLVAYAEMHFRHEEEVMESHDFPLEPKNWEEYQALIEEIAGTPTEIVTMAEEVLQQY